MEKEHRLVGKRDVRTAIFSTVVCLKRYRYASNNQEATQSEVLLDRLLTVPAGCLRWTSFVNNRSAESAHYASSSAAWWYL